MTREELNRRRDDIEQAVREGHSYAWLKKRWGLSYNGTWEWVTRNSTNAEMAALRPPGGFRRTITPALAAELAAWRNLGGAQA